jgi:hypothetical protein
MRVRLIHWRPEEAAGRIELLEKAGFDVDFEPFAGDTVRKTGENPPDAVLIDLARLPAEGRNLGINFRIRKSTRNIPLVFAGGAAVKIREVRKHLPDADFMVWDDIADGLEAAVSSAPSDPVVPSSTFAAYRGRPLVAKLAITAGKTILMGAPKDFESLLEPLPEEAVISRRASGTGRTVILFVRKMSELEKLSGKARSHIAQGGALWIAWPKKSSGEESDLTQASVRRFGLDSGLVDYKVCSIDSTWTGLRFAVRDK